MESGDVIAERFVVGGLAGSGTMGRVYKAYDRQLGQQVALKLMSANAPSARFQREGEVLAGLHHPNIVRHVAHGFSGGELFLAMEWLEGEDLASRLLRGPLSPEETLVVARQVAEALGAAHAHGVVHRDVKPSNLVLVQGSLSDLRVVDFGLAAVDASRNLLTQIGLVLGTPAYMAPEQVRGESRVDARADIFSLGCVLFECLASRCPFSGKTPLATFAKILIEDAPRVRELSGAVPEALDDLIARMLEKRPEERPRDGQALASAIARMTDADMAAVGFAGPPSLTRLEQRLVSVVLLERVLLELDPSAAAGSALTAASGDPAGPARAPTLLDLPVARSEADASSSRLEAVRAIAGRFGGEVDPLPDGSVVIVHVAREGLAEQAARGARTALAVQAAFPFVSIGVATGRSTAGQTRTIGEALDRAAGLLTRRALAHGIWIDDVSRGLLEARFEIDESSEGTRLTVERGAAKAERTLLGRQTSCVGREPELSTLLGLLQATIREREPRAALVLAAAGVGKSRLRYEFLRRASFSHPEASIWVGWGDPMGAGSPYGLVAPLIRRVLGLSDLDSPEQRRRTILGRVARSVSSSETLRVAEFLGELVGAHFPDEARLQLRAARNDAVLLGDQVLRAWGDFVAAESARSPVVMVLEDAHWADLPSLRLMDAAMASAKGLPVFVLSLARPEITTRFPGLWAERSVTRIPLSQLDAEASRAIITNALGQADEALIVRLVERAVGNAFYLEELIRAVADGRGISLPGTVLAVAQARLEGLTDAERRLLRAGSIFGASFTTSAVLALLGETDGDIEERLAALTEFEILLLVKDRLNHDAPEARFAFRHALLRDAAYAMLTPEDCALGHRLAGDWLERQPAGDPIVVADHLERAGAPERAGPWYRKAAAQALEGNDFGEVTTRVESAFRCAVTGVEAGLVHLVAAEARRWSNDNAEAARHGCSAMALLPHGSLPWFSAASEAAWALGHLGRFGELKDVARELDTASNVAPSSAVIAALARTSDQLLFAGEHALYRSLVDALGALSAGSRDDPVVETWLIHVRAGAAMMNDAGEYVMQMRALVASLEGIGDVRNACLQRLNLADAYIQVGLYAEAISLSRETLAGSNHLGLRMTAGIARSNLARALSEHGQLAEARALAAQVVAEMRVGQDHRTEAAAQGILARALMMSGQLPAAEDAVRPSLLLNRAPAPIRAVNLACLADVLLAQQRPADALPFAEEAFALLTTLGTFDDGEVYVELIHAEALLASGRADAARASIERARGRLLDKANRMSSTNWRTVFLTKVDANARTLSLARRICGP